MQSRGPLRPTAQEHASGAIRTHSGCGGTSFGLRGVVAQPDGHRWARVRGRRWTGEPWSQQPPSLHALAKVLTLSPEPFVMASMVDSRGDIDQASSPYRRALEGLPVW
jgi:hypothetical protein